MAVALAACGGKSNHSTAAGPSTPASVRGGEAPTPNAASALTGLRPGRPPVGWPVARIPSGASIAYPPGWTRIRSDPGTASAALLNARRQFLGYLNLTPRQGEESLANWARFRVDHNAEEGDRNVTTLAVRAGVRFRDGRGTCVIDKYRTPIGARYLELACLVSGKRATTAIVGATTPQSWAEISPLLERGVSSAIT